MDGVLKLEATFTSIDHKNAASSGPASFVIRPIVMAIKELTEALKAPNHFLSPQEPLIVTADAPIVHVNVPAQEKPVVNVNLPELDPTIKVTLAMPEQQASQVTIVIPYGPIIFVGLLNTISLIAVGLLLFFQR